MAHPLTSPARLAAAAVDTLVVAADGQARAASQTYWSHGKLWRDEVVRSAQALTDPVLRGLADGIARYPNDTASYFELSDLLARAARQPTPDVTALLDAGWHAEGMSRLGFHVGRCYVPDVPDIHSGLLGPVRAVDEARPSALVIVPFRGADPDGIRFRNVRATLQALGDQSLPRNQFHVTVVESDDRPRWREELTPLVDTYLFARKAGPFNKAWTVNVGMVHTPVDPELVCVIDADILTDRDFIGRNVDRFRQAGVGALLPHRDVLYLDPVASLQAIAVRATRGAVDLESMRGFVVRAPWGGCLWLRAQLFGRVGGMDERFEGWGGEDDDFAIRTGLWGAMDRYHDTLLHLAHPAQPAALQDGVPTNGPERPRFWPIWPIGALDRFTTEASHVDSD